MTDAEQRALLEDFCSWLWDEYQGAHAAESSDVDEFLASRQPQGEMGEYEWHSLESKPTAPEPTRFWRLFKNEHRAGLYGEQTAPTDYYWHPVNQAGEMSGRDGESFATDYRPTVELAEADGIASGLPEWVARGTGGGR